MKMGGCDTELELREAGVDVEKLTEDLKDNFPEDQKENKEKLK